MRLWGQHCATQNGEKKKLSPSVKVFFWWGGRLIGQTLLWLSSQIGLKPDLKGTLTVFKYDVILDECLKHPAMTRQRTEECHWCPSLRHTSCTSHRSHWCHTSFQTKQTPKHKSKTLLFCFLLTNESTVHSQIARHVIYNMLTWFAVT